MKSITKNVIIVLTLVLLATSAIQFVIKSEAKTIFNPISKKKQYDYERILFVGQVGEDVYRVKVALNALGYNVNKLNYVYDMETHNVVYKFQADHEMRVDGIVGKNTSKIIFNEFKSLGKAFPVVSSNIIKAPTNKYWVTINKNSNTLTLLRGKNIIKKYHIATGKDWTFTPEGKFKIVNKTINPQWFKVKGGTPENPLGYRWLGLSIKNGIIYGIHGNNNPRSIGTYASNGCIRMYNEDVEYLFKIIPVGTPVWIGSQNKLKSWGAF